MITRDNGSRLFWLLWLGITILSTLCGCVDKISFQDVDGDGYGFENDCDDEDPNVNPGAMEVPGNGINDNCDTSSNPIDEPTDDDYDKDGVSSKDGDCDDADPNVGGTTAGACDTLLSGACAAGTWQCVANKPECVPGVTEGELEEVCNDVDDDCDGQVDEENPGGGSPCMVPGKMGVCSLGVWNCQTGDLVCLQQNFPMPESCNGLDDNCDGTTDEGNPGGGLNCDSGLPGICGPGTTICQAPATPMASVVCEPNVKPGAVQEVCNGIDDDCDGHPTVGEQEVVAGQMCQCNDGTVQVCGVSNVGQCKLGQQTCINGAWGPCIGAVYPTIETCNGLDDDCDGVPPAGANSPDVAYGKLCKCQDGDVQSCGDSNVGTCKFGVQTCISGDWGPCVGAVYPTSETCNGLDDNCNGYPANALQPDYAYGHFCACNDGDVRSCGVSGTGACSFGLQTCSQGYWLPCVGAVYPVSESCGAGALSSNGVDDDCNGVIDDSLGSCQACVDIPDVSIFDLALIGGDREFNGHGPNVDVQVTITTNADQITVSVCVHMLETVSNWTEGKKCEDVIVPFTNSGLVNPSDSSFAFSYTDTNHSLDVFGPPFSSPVITGIECLGDLSGNDVCTGCSGCTIRFGCVNVFSN